MREALVDLLLHANYAEADVSLVTRAPGGYFFRNPGSSRVPEDDLFTGGDRSDPRNPTLVSMFRHVGLADEGGRGIPKILQAYRVLGLRPPTIDSGSERYEFSLQLRHAHLISEQDREWLHALEGEWTEAEQMALLLARHEKNMNNVRLRHRTGQHSADASRTLVGLRNREFLAMHREGRTSYTSWVREPCQRALAAWGATPAIKQGTPAITPEALALQRRALVLPRRALALRSRSRYGANCRKSPRDFVYVTTQMLTAEQLRQLSDEVGPERTLLVLCAAFRGDAGEWPNLTVRRSPATYSAAASGGATTTRSKCGTCPRAGGGARRRT